MQQYVFRLTVLIFVLVSLSGTAQKAQAQTHEFVHYGVDEGLSSTRISSLLQDSLGRIYIGTRHGLQVFDGYRFFSPAKRTNPKATEWIWQMKEKDSFIWILGSSPTIFKLKGAKVFSHPCNNLLYSSFRATNHISFQVKPHDTVNIGLTRTDYYLKLLPDSSVNKVSLSKEINSSCIYIKDAHDCENQLFGTYTQKGTSGPLEDLWIDGHYYPTPKIRSNSRVLVICLSDTTLAVAAGKYVFLVNTLTKAIEQTQAFPSDILSIYADRKMNIWVGFRDGFAQYDASLSQKKLENTEIRFVCDIQEDREGHIWLATVKGVHKLLNPYIKNISSYDGKKMTTESSPMLRKVDNKIFAVSDNVLYELLDDRITKLQNFRELGFGARNLSLGPGNVLYISSQSSTYKYENGVTTELLPGIRSQYGIITESDNSFWIVVKNNFRRYSSDGELLFDSSTQPEVFNIKEKRNITSLLCSDSEGGFWAIKGAILCHYSNGLLKQYPKHSDNFPVWRTKRFTYFNQKLWLANTESGVHFLYNDSMYNISSKDGLSSNRCNSILRESDSTIWVSTSHGLNHVTYWLEKEHLRTRVRCLRKEDGLSISESDGLALSKTCLWIANRNGFSQFKAQEYFANRLEAKPTIKITKVSINGKERSKKTSLHLKHDENKIQVHVKGISFRGVGPPEYLYRVVEIDSTWQRSLDTILSLGSLGNGKYTFQVKTLSKDETVSRKTAELSITISPPYWRTWWFITLIVILSQSVVVGLILVYARLRRRALLSDKKSLEAELRAIRSQINPHFMFNALNNLQERLKNSENELSSKHLNSFAELMRKVLWASRQTRISVKDEMEITQLYLGFATGHYRGKVSYSLNVSQDVQNQEELLQLPPLITQPLVENAVLHGAAKSQHDSGIVRMKVSMDKSNIVIDISDNGPGFASKKAPDSDKTRESVGSKLIMEHIDLLNQGNRQKIKYRVERIQNETHVILIIPIDI